MRPLVQTIWRHIWSRTVEKSQTNVTNVTLPLLGQMFWEHIWKRTVEKNQTNAASVIMLAPTQVLLEDIWRGTMKKGEKWLLPRTRIKDLESYNSNWWNKYEQLHLWMERLFCHLGHKTWSRGSKFGWETQEDETNRTKKNVAGLNGFGPLVMNEFTPK